MTDPDPIARVAFLRFSSVGDIVLTTPVLHALKRARPGVEIVYATKAEMRPLIAFNPNVDELVFLQSGESARAFARRLAERDVDAVVDLHGTLRTRAIRAALGVKKTVVWKKRPWQDNVPVRLGWRPYRAQMTISGRYHEAVERLLDESMPPGDLRYVVGSNDQAEADEQLSAAGIDRGHTLIGMSPGAKWDTKRWPIERFAELAERIDHSGWRIVVTGSPNEVELARPLLARAPNAISLAGKISLGALGGVIARCDAFVANDSGPMHIARGLGVPTLTFFGTTAPEQFDFTGHALMYARTRCSPCHFYGRTRCPKGHFRCMLDLDVDTAWSALVERVGSGPVPLVRG